MKRLLLLSLFLGGIQTIWSQEVNFEASAPEVVEVGEQFRLIFTVNSHPSSFQLTSVGGFNIIAGPAQSSMSSTQIVNGQVTQSENYAFTYILESDKEGKFKIGSAQIKVNGKTFVTKPFEIEVVKNSDSPNPAQSSSSVKGNSTNSAGDLFVRVEVNKRALYLGEALEAEIKIYVRGVNIQQFENLTWPSFNGFWSQEIETPSQLVFKKENVGGRIYDVGVMKKYLLFPQQTGTIKIDPTTIDLLLAVRSNTPQSIFDDFFGGNVQTENRHILSPAVTINVKSLPENGKPVSFSGAVGLFSMQGELDRQQLKANEAATYHLKVSGTGNLKLIDTPKMVFPPDFDTYDPKITENIKTSSSGASGSKIFDYPIIPRSAGTFTIPGVELSYFNPVSGKYSTIKTAPVTVPYLLIYREEQPLR